MALTLRPAQPADELFLFELYVTTRMEELAAWGWDASHQDVFLKLQFTAQQQHYRTHFAHADYSIVYLDDRPIGRLIVARGNRDIHIADIIVLPEYRGAGIGTTLIRDILAEAAQAQKSVRLQVLNTNRAIRLYERLGFTIIADGGTHFMMEARPSAAP
jgi:ribosomal protein S18 acetylase RimI-like enzyme